jgi:hypothetical protein
MQMHDARQHPYASMPEIMQTRSEPDESYNAGILLQKGAQAKEAKKQFLSTKAWNPARINPIKGPAGRVYSCINPPPVYQVKSVCAHTQTPARPPAESSTPTHMCSPKAFRAMTRSSMSRIRQK